ncbi:hypothetical protein [Sphingobacterium suaedae]|uniref:Dinitrogenase iron-molybdenum cofactor biosynthesis domain-containing protein n=1 Tax=Sphingobacterium suaedae TaxID=1686402 RepID=A0ABW5KGG3_9SPHI
MKSLKKQVEDEMNKKVLAAMVEVCHEAIESVRRKMLDKAYEDHTGNLNSSTGFIIYLNGKVLHKDFRLSNVGTDKQTGLDAGMETALGVMRETQGWGIVMASGMEYASWVESRGFTVIRGAAAGLESVLASAINRIRTIT